MGRLSDRWQVLILVAHADDDEDEQEALHIIFIFYVLDISAVLLLLRVFVVRHDCTNFQMIVSNHYDVYDDILFWSFTIYIFLYCI